MDALRRAGEYVRVLEARVRELETLVLEKDLMLRKLAKEVPGGERKLERLGVAALLQAPPNLAASPPVKWPAREVRKKFIEFFQSKGHTYWPSSPVVPLNDPTLMFANSGMNQFKPLFLGNCDPNLEMSKLKRACNTQKCLRAGGKHNDLEDVGFDSYHHSFFEMLGNWSFGDYFKKDAIDWAWELLTVEFKIDPTRLYATYFRGSDTVPADEEARQIWLKYLPEERVLPYAEKENFWEMGATGPCGPCTEIHYDRIGGRKVPHLVNADDPTLIEVWNNVFIQYNRNDDRSLTPLPNKHVDTGMGFERLVSVLQDKMSNYDTDVFMPLFEAIEKRSHVGPYQGRYAAEDPQLVDTAYRIVCDHLRALCHAVADGCVPDSTERGYVLRRILRRGVRHGMETLKADKMFFSSLVKVYAEHCSDIFPEVMEKSDFIQSVLEAEEKDFLKTLDKGRAFFVEVEKKIKAEGKNEIPGADAFFLYTTMGFPLDLTEIMAREKGMTVNKNEFQIEMEEFRKLSRNDHDAKQKDGGGGYADGFVPKLDVFATDALLKKSVKPTEGEPGKLSFDAQPSCLGTVVAIFDPTLNAFVDKTTTPGATYGIVLDKTNFYQESGGQVADLGKISTDDNGGAFFDVMDVQSSMGYVVHAGVLKTGMLQVGSSKVSCFVDVERRKQLAANHTSTHLLNFALRRVLKRELDQKGSLVTPEKLRFDFDSREPISPEQLEQVESVIRDQIAQNRPVYAKVVPLALAKSINTVRQVFSEQYPDPVRVVSVGVPVEDLIKEPTNEKWMDVSVEFCGGSHMSVSSDAKYFVLASEEGIAKGIRRIVGLTGDLALKATEDAKDLERRVSELSDIAEKSAAVQEAVEVEKNVKAALDAASISVTIKNKLRIKLEQINKTISKRLKDQDKALIEKSVKALNEAHPGSGIVVAQVSPETARVLSKVAQEFAEKRKASVFLFVSEGTDFAGSCFVVPDQIAKVKAKDWVAKLGVGKGGGRDNNASVRGPVGEMTNAVETARSIAATAGLV